MSAHEHHLGHAHAPLSERQAIEAAVYDARVRAALAETTDADLMVDAATPPYPNREHVDFLSFALSRIGTLEGARVLEVGCGTGALAVHLALRGAIVDGIDVSVENAALANRRAAANGVADRARFRVVPVESLDDADATYDAVIGNQVLHHFELADALRNIRRLLRPSGRALFCEPVLLLPSVLRRLRDTRPVKRVLPKRVDTPTERSVSREDVAVIRTVFPNARLYPFQLLARVQNFIELSDATFARLRRIDAALLRFVPPARQLCRFVVVEVAAPQQPDVAARPQL